LNLAAQFGREIVVVALRILAFTVIYCECAEGLECWLHLVWYVE
jgi:hypothetical protein